MKVLIAIHDYLPEHLGGSEMHAHQVALELKRRGHAVTVAHTERRFDRPEGDLVAGRFEDVPTLEMTHRREYADVRETYEQRLAGEVFRAVLARVRPDVVHFHHTALWGAGALEIAKESGARVVLTLHDYHLLCDRADLLIPESASDDIPRVCERALEGRCIDCIGAHPVLADLWDGERGDSAFALAAKARFEHHRRSLAAVDRVVSPSRFLRDLFVRAGLVDEAKSEVLLYGYPGPLAEPGVSDPNGPLRIGYLGGIYPAKGVHVAVDAMGHLKGVRAELHVHGVLEWFPEYVADLRRRADGLPLEFHGRLDPAERDATLQALDVLVVPSVWYENMPLTIWEAFRNGVPVVTSDFGGMAEAVRDGQSGLLFPRGDARALAAGLGRLAADRTLLARLARGRPDVPDMGPIVDRLLEIYRGR